VKFGLCSGVVLILVGLLGAPLLGTAQSVAQEKPNASDAPKVSGEPAESAQPSSHSAKKASKSDAEPAAGGNVSPGKQEQEDPGIYHIGIEDELQISVWKEPEISTTVVVRPDGMITLPLLNDVHVLGLQTTELQAVLTEKLKPFVNEPQVTIIVRGIKSRKVYVYGQVSKAGAYSLVGRKTVLEVLSEAGGLSLFAKKGSIYVLRNVDNKKTKLPFNYNNALKAKHPNDNFDLFPGDIVVVP
jgi:polysaccharide biosynthesis/export protein